MSLDSIKKFIKGETVDEIYFGEFEGPNIANITLSFKSGRIIVIESAIINDVTSISIQHIPALKIKVR